MKHEVTIADCRSDIDGGGIFLDSNNDFLTATHLTFSEVWASGDGGGVYAHRQNRHVYILSPLVDGSAAKFDGGWLYLYEDNDHWQIENGTVRWAEAGAYGGLGALYHYNDNVTVLNLHLEGSRSVDDAYDYRAGTEGFYTGLAVAVHSGLAGGFSLYEGNNDFTLKGVTCESSILGRVCAVMSADFSAADNNDGEGALLYSALYNKRTQVSKVLPNPNPNPNPHPHPDPHPQPHPHPKCRWFCPTVQHSASAVSLLTMPTTILLLLIAY